MIPFSGPNMAREAIDTSDIPRKTQTGHQRWRQIGWRQSTPLVDDTDPIREFSIDPGSYGLAKPNRSLSEGEAHTEYQYRPQIVDADRIADAVFADAVSETSNQRCAGSAQEFPLNSFEAPYKTPLTSTEFPGVLPNFRISPRSAIFQEIWESEFYTPPPLEARSGTDTLNPSPTPVVYSISGPMRGGFYTPLELCSELSKEWVPPLYTNQSSKIRGEEEFT